MGNSYAVHVRYFAEFAVPTKEAPEVEQIIARTGVTYSVSRIRTATIFVFTDDEDFFTAGKAVSNEYDDIITSAIHKAINGVLTPSEALWADWESLEFRSAQSRGLKSRPISADEIIDAYQFSKSIKDKGARERALAHVKVLSQKLR